MSPTAPPLSVSKFTFCSKQVPLGVFSLNLFGVQHYILSQLSVIQALFNKHSATLSFDNVRWTILVNVFGANSKLKPEYTRVRSDAQDCITHGLLREPGASELVNRTVRAIEKLTPDLVSFSESMVDQSPWERAGSASLQGVDKDAAGTPSVEVDLFTLIRNFVGHVTLPSLVGSEFMDVYPKAMDDLWEFDSGWDSLVLGLPRIFPLPSLATAHIARRNLLEAMGSFHEAIDKVSADQEPSEPWRELRDVSQIMAARSFIWRTHATPPGIKGPADLSLLWVCVKPLSYF